MATCDPSEAKFAPQACTKLCKALIATGLCDNPECRYAHSQEDWNTSHRDMFIETIWEWPCDFFVQDSKGLLLCFPTLPLCFVSIQNETTNISGTNRTEIYSFAVTQPIFFQRPFYFVHLLFGCQWVDSAWVLDPQGTPPYAVWTSVWSSWAWEGERSSCTARVLEVVAATEVSMFLPCSSAA